MPARVVDRQDGRLQVETLGKQYFSVPCPDPAPKLGEQATLVVRPEAITLNHGGKIHAVVKRASYLGSVIEYEVLIMSEQLQITEYDPLHANLYPLGTSVYIGLIEDLLYVLPADDPQA